VEPLFGDDGLDRFEMADWGPVTVNGIPFRLIDPRPADQSVPNIILLHTPKAWTRPNTPAVVTEMPRSVTIPVGTSTTRIHLLGCVSGWGWPYRPSSGPNQDLFQKGSVSAVVRILYADGQTEEHQLRNGEHIADYVRRIDVPESTFAFLTENGKQVRYTTVSPARSAVVKELELVKGENDGTAPLFFAVTLERLVAAEPSESSPDAPKILPATRVLRGPERGVNDVVFSPDRRRAAGIDWGGTVYVWDAASGQPLHTLEGTSRGSAGALAASPDGRHLYAVSHEMPVRVIAWETGAVVHRFETHVPNLRGVAVAADGREFAVCGDSPTVVVRAAATGEEVRRFETDFKMVWSVAFSPDGTRLAACGSKDGPGDDAVVMWDRATGQELRRFAGHTRAVRWVTFGPDGKSLATAGFDGRVRLWEAETGRQTLLIEAHQGFAERVHFLPGGTHLLTCGGPAEQAGQRTTGMAVTVWEVATGRPVASGNGGHEKGIIAAAVSRDGRSALSGSRDGTARVWAIPAGVSTPPPPLAVAPKAAEGKVVFSAADAVPGLVELQYPQRTSQVAPRMIPAGWHVHAWKTGIAAEAEVADVDGVQALTIRNLPESTAHGIELATTAPVMEVAPATRYVVRLTYKADGPTKAWFEARSSRSNRDKITRVNLHKTNGWEVAELEFTSDSDHGLFLNVSNDDRSGRSRVSIRSIEVTNP
jgi:WD40 repeat protein